MKDSFTSDEISLLNAQWIPNEAGTACLSLLTCLNRISKHWKFLTAEENSRCDWTLNLPPLTPEQLCLLAIRKRNWLQQRLDILLDQLGQSQDLAAFFSKINVVEISALETMTTDQLEAHGTNIDKQIVAGIESMRIPLVTFGTEKELPQGWQIIRLDDTEMGFFPVRDIPELIIHLKSRTDYLRPHIRSSENHRLLISELQNARLAIRSLVHDPRKWPKFDFNPEVFDQSFLQLENLIDHLSRISADNAVVNAPDSKWPADGDLVTIEDVAKLVGVSAKTVRNTDSKTWGRHKTKLGRELAWLWGDIKWIVQNKRKRDPN